MSKALLSLPLRALLAAVLVCVSTLHAAAHAAGTPLLYEVRSESGVVYLFGTIHVGTRSMYPLNREVEAAYAASRVLALEADPTDQSAAMAAMAQGIYRPPDTIRGHISPALFAQLQAALPAVGLPLEYAQAMKPPLLAMTLSMLQIQRLGYDASLGLDAYFASQAKAQGKQIVQLESLAEQMALFEDLPAQVQEQMLAASLDSIGDGKLDAQMEDLIAGWSAGDAQRIERNVLEELEQIGSDSARLLEERLYTKRNRAMAEKVAQMLAGGNPTFVAVGAGHLTGESGLPELLRRMGYAVKRL